VREGTEVIGGEGERSLHKRPLAILLVEVYPWLPNRAEPGAIHM
jgi:hypothetical protein